MIIQEYEETHPDTHQKTEWTLMTDDEKYIVATNDKATSIKPIRRSVDKLLLSDWEKYKTTSILETVQEVRDRASYARVSAHLKHTEKVIIKTVDWTTIAMSVTPYQLHLNDTHSSVNLAGLW